MKQEGLLINSFGNALDELKTVDLVELTACSIFDDFQANIEAFAVDVICSKIQSQDLKKVQEYYTCLSGLNLGDKTDASDETGLGVDILIGGDQMYKVFTGREVRGEKGKPGPIAYEIGLGYVLSGRIDLPDRRVKTKINFAATHVLHAACTEQSLDDKISMMWDLHSMGTREPQTVYEAFQENITQEENGQYTVWLPFKDNGRLLPDNHDLSIKRLQSLIHRLKKEPEILN